MSGSNALFPVVIHADLADSVAQRHCETLLTGLERTLRVARALTQVERAVDLTGLDGGFGIACAKVLDLPLHGGRALLPRLIAIRDQLDSLERCVRLTAPAHAAPDSAPP